MTWILQPDVLALKQAVPLDDVLADIDRRQREGLWHFAPRRPLETPVTGWAAGAAPGDLDTVPEPSANPCEIEHPLKGADRQAGSSGR